MSTKRKPVENGKIKIERGVPLPGSNKEHKPIYPLSRMQAGDSFFVSKDHYRTTAGGRKSSIRYSALRQDIKICIRTVTGGFRVWRVQ